MIELGVRSLELDIFVMKKYIVTLLLLLAAELGFAINTFFDGFEYGNHDLQSPIGWTCDDDSWLCGYLEKDHNRVAHTGDWYAFTNSDESWMFMPMFMGHNLKYRFSLWAISDGDYQIEIWAGDASDPASMTHMLMSETVTENGYQYLSAYIDGIPSDYQCFGIHAVSAGSGSILTIDEVNVDMVVQYEFHTDPVKIETEMSPGAQATFNFKLINDGYETIRAYIHPTSEHFSDIQLYVDDQPVNAIDLVQDQVVPVRGVATLSPDALPDQYCWFDVMFTIDCGCATAMFTYWVKVVDDGIAECDKAMSVYPNPAADILNVRVEGLQQVDVLDLSGHIVLGSTAYSDDLVLDLSALQPGAYIIKTVSRHGTLTQRFIKE